MLLWATALAAVCSLFVTGGPGGALLAIATIAVTISAWLRSKESRAAYRAFLLLIAALVLGAVLMALFRAPVPTWGTR